MANSGKFLTSLLRGLLKLMRGRSCFASYEEIFERNFGIIGNTLRNKTIFVLGGGSVGSLEIEKLTRSGVGEFVLFDNDRFSAANIARHVLTLDSIGKPKVVELENRAKRINPGVKITSSQEDFTELSFDKRRHIFTGVDLFISTTDSNEAEFEAALTAYLLGIPYIHVGCHERAGSGELLYQIPGFTKYCMNCWLGFRRGLPQQQGETLDYSDIPVAKIGRVIAEPGLYIDISTIVGISSQFALAILLGPESPRWHSLVDPERNLVLINGSCANNPIFSEPFQVSRPSLQKTKSCEICEETENLDFIEGFEPWS